MIMAASLQGLLIMAAAVVVKVQTPKRGNAMMIL